MTTTQRNRRLGMGLVGVALIATVAGAIGSVYIPPWTVAKIVVQTAPLVDLSQTWPDSWETIIWKIRLPRIVLAGMVGAALAVSGATYQGLFRNPLADPFFLGVAAGAALGATIVLLTSVPVYYSGLSLLPLAAFVGAMATVTVTYGIVRQSGCFCGCWCRWSGSFQVSSMGTGQAVRLTECPSGSCSPQGRPRGYSMRVLLRRGRSV